MSCVTFSSNMHHVMVAQLSVKSVKRVQRKFLVLKFGWCSDQRDLIVTIGIPRNQNRTIETWETKIAQF